MDLPAGQSSGAQAEGDEPIPYLARIREYYETLGFGAPYQWAQFAEVPFTRLSRPLREITVGLVTTAAPYQPGKGDQGPGAPYNAAAKFYTVYSGDTAETQAPRISHLGYDRAHTSADDPNTWFPLSALHRAAARGRIARVAPRFHGAPTNRSQRTTLEVDCVEILARCRADDCDAVLLVAN